MLFYRAALPLSSRTLTLVAGVIRRHLCVPKTSSTLCDQAVFVDEASGVGLPSDAEPVEIDLCVPKTSSTALTSRVASPAVRL